MVNGERSVNMNDFTTNPTETTENANDGKATP